MEKNHELKFAILQKLASSQDGIVCSGLAGALKKQVSEIRTVIHELERLKRITRNGNTVSEGALFVITQAGREYLTRTNKPVNLMTENEIKRHLNNTTPAHYQGKTMQVFDVLNEFLTPEAVAGFHAGNVIKYILRYKEKGGREDLLKARHYIDELIEAY